MNNSKFEQNLTEGSVAKKLLLFSMPFLISNLIQSLYSVADMIIVGKFSGAMAMSGVNIGSQVTFIVTNMVFGICIGGTVLIGQYKGAGDKNAIRETIGTLFTGLIIAAVVLTVAIIAVQDPILKLIKTPEESYAEAKVYFFVTMLGNVFIFGYNALAAVMRGLGDSKNPLYFVAIACGANIVLDLALVGGLKMGAMGAAIATVASQAVSMILCVIYLARNDFIFDFKLKSFSINRRRLGMILKIGIPSSIQNVAVGLSFMFLTTLVNDFGFTASAAVGAVGKFNGFAILPAAAMSSAISAMCAQNIGAGEIGRARKTLFIGIGLAAAISYSMFAFISFFPEWVLKIFVDANDPDAAAVVAFGVEYISSFRFDYLIIPFVFCLNGLFIGAGHTKISLINGLMSSVLFRIPFSYLFGVTLGWGLAGVGVGAPLASAASLVSGVIFFCTGKWKKLVIAGVGKRNSDTAEVPVGENQ